MSHDTALGGAKNLGQKALFFTPGAIFWSKKAQNGPKLAKIDLFIEKVFIFLASDFFQ